MFTTRQPSAKTSYTLVLHGIFVDGVIYRRRLFVGNYCLFGFEGAPVEVPSDKDLIG